MQLQLGWKAGPEQFPPNELLDCAVAAEQAGFDAIDTSDHFHPWSEAGQACFTWTWLGAVAARTQSIRLGPGITCPILRYHPSIIAQAAATLSAMTGGRAFLGVGTGEALNEYAAVGQWPEYNQRQKMLAEAIMLMRELWSGQEVSYDGEYFSAKKARLYTPPASAIPIYVSTLVPASAEFAGRYGDGLITVGGKEPDIYRKMNEAFESGAREAGKEPASLRRAIELFVEYTDDEQTAIATMRKYWAGAFVPALYTERIYTPKLSEENGKVVGADTVRQMACISGNADRHVEYAQQYMDLGFDTLFFHSASEDQQGFIEHFGRDVLPRLRAARQSQARSTVAS